MARSSLVMMSLVWVYNFGTAEIMFELDMYRSYPASKMIMYQRGTTFNRYILTKLLNWTPTSITMVR